MNDKKKAPKRIVVEVPDGLHAELKTMAAFKVTTLRKYVLKAVLLQLNNDKKTL